MRIQKITIGIILLLFTLNLSAQKINEIDFDLIKTQTQDSLSYHYYPILLQRFLEFDSTLTAYEYELLYYGNVFTEAYNPYSTSENETKFLELYKKQEYNNALPFGLEVIKENPINTKILFKLLVIYNQLEDNENEAKYASLYYNLLYTIYSSGDGKSAQTAIVVISVSDEYEIIAELQLNFVGQALVGDCDLINFNMKTQKKIKGKKPIKELYFNVSKPLDYLNDVFKKD